MAKYAVYNVVHQISNDNQLKRLSLLFDKIYVGWYNSFSNKQEAIIGLDKRQKKRIEIFISQENVLFDFLQEKGIIHNTHSIPINSNVFNSSSIIEQQQNLFNEYIKPKIGNIDSEETKSEILELMLDNMTRLETANITNQLMGDFFPILRSAPPISHTSKKENIVRLLLNNIPEPDPNTPWEQIIDFRSDTETRIKYLALINWANEMASSSLTPNEIQEKYEYLYLQYLAAYKIHKIKSSFGVIEILTALGMSLASGNIATIPALVTNFFKIGTYTFSFLKEEKSLPGKELSYIYHSRLELGGSDEKSLKEIFSI